MFRLLALITQGRIGITSGAENASGLYIDRPMPFHTGYSVPKGMVVVSSGGKDWWTDKVCFTHADTGPGGLCDQLLIPRAWDQRVLVGGQQESSVLVTAPSKRRHYYCTDMWKLYRITLQVQGIGRPIYVCAGDLAFERETTVVIDPYVVAAAEEHGYESHVVGVTPGVLLLEGGLAPLELLEPDQAVDDVSDGSGSICYLRELADFGGAVLRHPQDDSSRGTDADSGSDRTDDGGSHIYIMSAGEYYHMSAGRPQQ